MKNNTCQSSLEEIFSLYSIPVSLTKIAEDEGLCVIYDDYGRNTFDGMTWYEPGQNKFYIHINTARGNGKDNNKGRFTLAHELGHYYIDHHRQALINGKMSPHIHRYQPFGNNENWEIEREADVLAANLLLPITQFKEDLKEATFSGQLIQRLASKYKVSFSACALRYVELNFIPIMLVLAERGKIRWQMKSKDFPFYRLRYGTDRVPENTVMGDYFYKNDSSCCKKSEVIYAEDCFHTYNDEQNRMQFYEYCIPYDDYAFSMFWEK